MKYLSSFKKEEGFAAIRFWGYTFLQLSPYYKVGLGFIPLVKNDMV